MSSFSLVLTVAYRYEYVEWKTDAKDPLLIKKICLVFCQKIIVLIMIMEYDKLFVGEFIKSTLLSKSYPNVVLRNKIDFSGPPAPMYL